MAKFRSKSTATIGGQEVADGTTVEAHVVSADEKTLQVPVGSGVEHLVTGDALVTLADKSQHVVRAAAFAAQFEPSTAAKGSAKEAGKGSAKEAGKTP